MRAGALAAVASLAFAAPAGAAVKSELDPRGGMRLTLDGRTLVAEIVHTPRYTRFPTTEEQLYGRRVAGACGTTFRPIRRGLVFQRRTWPAGARRLTFNFGRDISRRVRWCLVDSRDGDVAFVSFVDREPSRFVAKGRALSGEWWRLRGWRDEQLEPCLMLRTGRDPHASSGRCFTGLAEREATLAVDLFVDGPDVYLVGVVARTAAKVRVRMGDGTVIEPPIHARPTGSRVRASFFVLPLRRGTEIVGARAVAADGSTLKRKRLDFR
jgi:hypothetical protein